MMRISYGYLNTYKFYRINYQTIIETHPLKEKCNFDEIFVTGDTGSCHFEFLTTSSRANDDNFVEMTFVFQRHWRVSKLIKLQCRRGDVLKAEFSALYY